MIAAWAHLPPPLKAAILAKKAGRAGRRPRLGPAQLEKLSRGLKEGPEALGFGTGLWTTWRVADLIERQTEQKFHPGHVWRILRGLGWSCQRPAGRATQRDEGGHPALEAGALAGNKKKRSSKAER